MRRFIVVTLTFLFLLTAVDSAAAQTGRDLFQQALVKERANGDFRGAIEIYERIVREFTDDRSLTASTLVQLGQCYEKLGSAEAERSYQRVVSEFADQADFVAQARARLTALRSEPATPGRGPAARMLLTSFDSADVVIGNPRTMVPSPDGRRVAYAQTERQDAGVYVRDLASGAVQQVAAREPTANGGNWSVVWSADGRRLAFQQTNAETHATTIRILDLTSRETVAIPGLDAGGLYLLDWSRDGQYILCNHEKNTLELVTVADGTKTTLSDSTWIGSRASFSPDGRFVAYAAGAYGNESLYTKPLAGGPRTRITDALRGVYLHPFWSPDGKAIAYQHPDGIWVVPVTDGAASGPPRLVYRTDIPRWGIAWAESGGLYFTFNAERSSAYQVAVDPASGRLQDAGVQELPAYPADFAWSPDMQRVVSGGGGNGIRVYATDTRTMTSYDLENDDALRAWWSADGREVVYYTGDPSSQTGQLKAVDAGTGQIRAFSPRMQGWVGSLSADGSSMVIMRRASESGALELAVAATGQPDSRVVASGPGPDGSRLFGQVWPTLSPRGDQVLFARQGGGDQSGSGQNIIAVWVVASDGTGARRLAAAPAISGATWDPSGRYIAYTALADSTTCVLHIVEVATGVERDSLLLPGPGYWGINDWSPDGRFIGMAATRGWWEYWVVEGLQEGGR